MRKFEPDSQLNVLRARGHLVQQGHVLTGYWSDDEFPYLIRTCC